jgi:hypothetical protein
MNSVERVGVVGLLGTERDHAIRRMLASVPICITQPGIAGQC